MPDGRPYLGAQRSDDAAPTRSSRPPGPHDAHAEGAGEGEGTVGAAVGLDLLVKGLDVAGGGLAIDTEGTADGGVGVALAEEVPAAVGEGERLSPGPAPGSEEPGHVRGSGEVVVVAWSGRSGMPQFAAGSGRVEARAAAPGAG